MQHYIDLILFWISAGLIGANLTHAWLLTNFPIRIWNMLFAETEKPAITRNDMVHQAFARFGGFGDLVVCSICSGTWLALVGVLLAWVMFPQVDLRFGVVIVLGLPWLFAKSLAPPKAEPSAKTAMVATSAEHPEILRLIRHMKDHPEEDPPAVWKALMAELTSPSRPDIEKIVRQYRSRVAAVKDETTKSIMMRATLGKIYDLGVR